MKNNYLTACVLALQGLMIAAVAMAAPVAPDAADMPQQPAASALVRPSDRASTVESANGSRSVDLLIELQNKTAGLDFNERARENGNTARSTALPVAGATQATTPGSATPNAAGLFGSGAVPMPPPRETTAKESDFHQVNSRSNESSSGYQPSRDNTQNDDGAGGGRVSLPREVIRWVRENRGMVVGGALLALVALWGTSVAVGQRRR